MTTNQKDAEALSREAFESAPINEAPMNGEIVSVLYPMRYLPYKKDGQRQMGVKGRWQEYTGYGWKNADFTPERFLKPLERAQPAPAAGDGINWARNILATINAWKAGEDDGGGVIAKAESYAKAALATLPAPSVGAEDEAVHVELIIAIEALEFIATCEHLNDPAKVANDALNKIAAGVAAGVINVKGEG